MSGHIDKNPVGNTHNFEANSKLEDRPKRQDYSSLESIDQGDEDSTRASIPADEYRHLTEKYNELNKKYQETYQRLKYIEKKNTVLAQQNKDMKESVRAWQKYCDHLENKQKLKSEPRATVEPEKLLNPDEKHITPPFIPPSPGSTAIQTPGSPVGLGRSSPTSMHPLTHVEFPPEKDHIPSFMNKTQTITEVHTNDTEAGMDHDGSSTQDEDTNGTGDAALQRRVSENPEFEVAHDLTTVSAEQSTPTRINSSQTTVDETATQNLNESAQALVSHEEDDVPQFVSERSLKRKRGTKTQFNVYSDRTPYGTPTNPVKVKEEQFSSPPALTAAHLLRKETIDLDELGPNVISTPHSNRRRNVLEHSDLTRTLRYQRSTSDSLIKIEGADVQDELSLQQTTEDGTSAEVRACSEPSVPHRHGPKVLQPLDPNIQTTGPIEGGTPKKRRKKDRIRQSGKYEVLTESGEGLSPEENSVGQLPPNVARTRFNRRLQASKDSRTPAKSSHNSPTFNRMAHITAQVPTPPSSSSRQPYTPTTRLRARRGELHDDPSSDGQARSLEPPKSDSRPAWQLRMQKDPSPDTRSTLRKAPPSKLQPTPLRNKPKSELGISDFKPNPAFNSGYSYAFAETIRKRADRACLPGCTRPECCGSTFRTLAAAAGPLSPSEEENLLEEYLGDAYDSLSLTQMMPEERKELVLQARTRQMAKQHGRHRQAYERHTTPPGFWRIDFPTTQEDMEDKKQAAEQERRLVEERWMEAMRKGGRWMFRDE